MKWLNKILATLFGVGTTAAAAGAALVAQLPEGKASKAITVGAAAAGTVGGIAGALMRSPLVAHQNPPPDKQP